MMDFLKDVIIVLTVIFIIVTIGFYYAAITTLNFELFFFGVAINGLMIIIPIFINIIEDVLNY